VLQDTRKTQKKGVGFGQTRYDGKASKSVEQ
jgi:hypothetical protein